MALTDFPIFSMLRTRMDWAQARQRVLSENVANADTPNYRPHDLVAPKFAPATDSTPVGVPPVILARTDAGHLPAFAAGNPAFRSVGTGGVVNLEQEMMKVAGNTMDFQAVSALYTRSLNLLKVALGKSNNG
jgi:flagellar basal-body rod protein FlgB